jgi:hypothetical protein
MNEIVARRAAPMTHALEPTNMEEAIRFADLISRSDMVPAHFKGKPANILLAVQWGREIGLGPLQALNNIAVINGRPSLWGDAMMALVRGSGVCLYVRETMEGDGDTLTAVCRSRRKDDDGEHVTRFSVADAKKAGLWGKQGPWQQHPRRMLQMRARGFNLRDHFPDVLRGVISAEEAQDIPADPVRNQTTVSGIPPVARLDAFEQAFGQAATIDVELETDIETVPVERPPAPGPMEGRLPTAATSTPPADEERPSSPAPAAGGADIPAGAVSIDNTHWSPDRQWKTVPIWTAALLLHVKTLETEAALDALLANEEFDRQLNAARTRSLKHAQEVEDAIEDRRGWLAARAKDAAG